LTHGPLGQICQWLSCWARVVAAGHVIIAQLLVGLVLVLPPSAIESTNAPSLEDWTRSLPRPDHGSAPGRPTCNASIWADPHRRWSEPASGNRTGPWGLEAGLVGPVSHDATRCFPACPALLVRPGPVSAVASVPRMHARHPRRVVARGTYGLGHRLGLSVTCCPPRLYPPIRARAEAARRACRVAILAARLPSLIHPIAFSRSRTTDHGPRGSSRSPEPSAPPAPTRGSPHHDERR